MLERLAKTSLLLFPLFFSVQNYSLAQDPGIPDTVRVSSASGVPGSRVVLTVTGFNDEELSGVLIPLRFPSSFLIADSVSYVGSRLSGASIKPFSIDSTNQTLSFGAVYFGAPLDSGDGLLGKIYFSVKPTAVAETVVIDTFFSPPSVLTFSDPGAIEWTPQFKPGKITIDLINLPPVWVPIGNKSVLEGDTLKILLKAKDPTFEALTFAVLSGPPGSSLTQLSDSTALFTWVPSFIGPYSASGSPFKITFIVSDGVNFVRQDVSIYVINKGIFALQIEDDNSYPGDSAVVRISLSNSNEVVGFRLLVHYDQSVLNVRRVNWQNSRIKDWKLFSYQLDPKGVSGDILLLGQADAIITPQTVPLPVGEGTIAELVFQVGRDCLFSGRSVPVYFVFPGALDNTLAEPGGSIITQKEISFDDGNVHILQALIGDINDNGAAYEIGDAVLFSNYLLYGDSVFFSDPERRAAQIAATDINLDGYVLTVGDLTLLIRIIGGQPPPQCGVLSGSRLSAEEGKR